MTTTDNELLSITTACEVNVFYLDSTKVTRTAKGKLSTRNVVCMCSRFCDTLADAKGYIVAIRKHAAKTENIALLSIEVNPDLGDKGISPRAAWRWTATEEI